MNTELKVQSFTDYRTFLVAHVQQMKLRTDSWSYGRWARALGLKNTSSITKIIQGDRNPGGDMTEKLVRYFKLSAPDADYFRDLVRLRKASRDPRLAALLLERMGKSHPNGSVRLLDDKSFSVISNWYHLPLREFVRMHCFLEDHQWIAKKMRFKVSPREVKQALTAMLGLGLLTRNAKGQLTVTDGTLNTTSDVASEAIKRYHEQMLDNAKQAIRTVALDERELTGASLVMKTSDLPRAKEMIREFRRNFARTFETADGDGVFQIQLQLFPLTKKGDLQ